MINFYVVMHAPVHVHAYVCAHAPVGACTYGCMYVHMDVWMLKLLLLVL